MKKLTGHENCLPDKGKSNTATLYLTNKISAILAASPLSPPHLGDQLRAFLISSLFVVPVIVGCGGSSGDITDSPRIAVLSPAQDSVFTPGESVPIQLSVDNFTLMEPTPKSDREAMMLQREILGSTLRHGVGGEEDEATNPDAREGHYHVFLNQPGAVLEHETSWTKDFVYSVPSDLTAGSYDLVFELRDNNHVKVGVEEHFFFSIGGDGAE